MSTRNQEPVIEDNFGPLAAYWADQVLPGDITRDGRLVCEVNRTGSEVAVRFGTGEIETFDATNDVIEARPFLGRCGCCDQPRPDYRQKVGDPF